MNLLNPSSPKQRNNFVSLLILTFVFILFVFLNRQSLFQKFNPKVVDDYLRSQDIEDRENRIKDRIFMSDSDIYVASGYLYANGADPKDLNLHPPVIKYLFGYSSKYFNLPLFPNIILGAILILEIFLLGKLVFKNTLIGLLSSILIMFDPVFKEVTTYALLDLGQMVFILGFLITTLFYNKNLLLRAILLGLSFASKFYSPVFVLLGLTYIYEIYNKNFNLKEELLVLFISLLIFSLTYVVSFPFNIFFYQARVIKFMLSHNGATEWGGVLKMFFTGYFLWPILFLVNLFLLFKEKLFSLKFLIFVIPVVYFLISTFQLPFTRYFILILPFLYLSLTSLICKNCLK